MRMEADTDVCMYEDDRSRETDRMLLLLYKRPSSFLKAHFSLTFTGTTSSPLGSRNATVSSSSFILFHVDAGTQLSKKCRSAQMLLVATSLD